VATGAAANHWFDALFNACAAGHGCGVRLVQEQLSEPPPKPELSHDSHISGREWMAFKRRW